MHLPYSVCHVILKQETYDMLDEPDDDENDMLDLAFGKDAQSFLSRACGAMFDLSQENEGVLG